MSSRSMLGHHYKIRVVLTAASNAFLADRLPLAGELDVLEMTTDGRITPGKAVFRTFTGTLFTSPCPHRSPLPEHCTLTGDCAAVSLIEAFPHSPDRTHAHAGHHVQSQAGNGLQPR